MSEELFANLKQHALNMRKKALEMAFISGTSAHLGGGLSFIDAASVLYGSIMNTSDLSLDYSKRDKFILSKGHGVLGLYSALYEYGIIDEATVKNFMQNGSDLTAHPVMKPELGIETSSGSLGQGISLAVGLALASKKKDYSYHTYVVCGNGECNEGSVWEACMSAVSYKLDNLTIFVDNNGMQSDGFSNSVMNVSTKYGEVFRALGFNVKEVDGHNIEQLYTAFSDKPAVGVPKVVIGTTVKGKGVSFMENNNEWHHNRLIEERYNEALEELIRKNGEGNDSCD